MTSPTYWQDATKALAKADPVLGKIIRAYKGETLVGKGDPFLTLARAIVGQQISVKAADSVWRKLEGVLGTVTPMAVIALTDEELRSAGLSRQKALYIRDLSRYFHNEGEVIARWAGMEDEVLIKSLITIKGTGRWTAEMFLIFHLLRSDVLPLDDLGLQKAFFLHYFNGEKQSLKVIKEHAERWRPYRSVATWYLWRSLDPVPVEY